MDPELHGDLREGQDAALQVVAQQLVALSGEEVRQHLQRVLALDPARRILGRHQARVVLEVAGDIEVEVPVPVVVGGAGGGAPELEVRQERAGLLEGPVTAAEQQAVAAAVREVEIEVPVALHIERERPHPRVPGPQARALGGVAEPAGAVTEVQAVGEGLLLGATGSLDEEQVRVAVPVEVAPRGAGAHGGADVELQVGTLEVHDLDPGRAGHVREPGPSSCGTRGGGLARHRADARGLDDLEHQGQRLPVLERRLVGQVDPQGPPLEARGAPGAEAGQARRPDALGVEGVVDGNGGLEGGHRRRSQHHRRRARPAAHGELASARAQGAGVGRDEDQGSPVAGRRVERHGTHGGVGVLAREAGGLGAVHAVGEGWRAHDHEAALGLEDLLTVAVSESREAQLSSLRAGELERQGRAGHGREGDDLGARRQGQQQAGPGRERSQGRVLAEGGGALGRARDAGLVLAAGGAEGAEEDEGQEVPRLHAGRVGPAPLRLHALGRGRS